MDPVTELTEQVADCSPMVELIGEVEADPRSPFAAQASIRVAGRVLNVQFIIPSGFLVADAGGVIDDSQVFESLMALIFHHVPSAESLFSELVSQRLDELRQSNDHP
jgi:hypothetical protein